MDIQPIWVQDSSPQPLPSSDNLQTGKQTLSEVSKYVVQYALNQLEHLLCILSILGTGNPAAHWGRYMGSLVLRTLQSPATSLCRAEVQEIRSSGCREVCARARSGFHMLNLWPHPSAEPARCLGVCGCSSLRGGGGGGGSCKGSHQLSAHKRRCSLRDTDVGNFWFAMENVPTGQKTSCMDWPGS